MIISVDPGGRLSGYVSFSRKSLLEAFVLGDPRSPTTLLTFSIECMSTCLQVRPQRCYILATFAYKATSTVSGLWWLFDESC